MIHLRISITFLLLTSLVSWVSAEGRTWTDSTGKFKTEAEFVSLADGKVTLQKPNGKTVVLPLERLSEDDQQFVHELLDESPSARCAPSRPNNVINSVRGAVYRNETLNKMKNIALAISNYESTHRRFPAQSTNAQTPAKGLSWRVAILPFIEEQPLYDQFHLDEPWDSEHNLSLVERMPDIYRSPGSDLDGGLTNYVAVVASNTVVADQGKGTRIQDISDGTSRTVMLIEADDTHAVVWTQPDDYRVNPASVAEGIGHIWAGQFCAAMADGSIRFISLSAGSDTLRGLFSRNGGERIDPNDL